VSLESIGWLRQIMIYLPIFADKTSKHVRHVVCLSDGMACSCNGPIAHLAHCVVPLI
jgi:hypothetical protein